MRRFIAMLCILLLSGCARDAQPTTETAFPEASAAATTAAPEPPETTPQDPIRLMLNDMSLEERVGQLFLARCDEENALAHIEEYHLGGYVLFGQDFVDVFHGFVLQK